MKLLGVDTGGTFTDFVLLDEQGTLRVHKVLSRPDAPEQAILQGVAELGLTDRAALRVVHGSTVATNAVLERRGARTLYVTNAGLGDVLAIGRQHRPRLYDLEPRLPPPPVPPGMVLEVAARTGADGRPVAPLADADLEALRQALVRLAPEAVAINLLFSFLDETDEARLAAAVPEGIFVSRSSQVLPEYKEYERGIATWLNAYVGPLLQGYLRRLREGLAPAPVAVMQSSGETIAAEQAGAHGVRLLLSGPAGGLAAARYVGERCGRTRLLTFDMGGTSTDVALIDGEIRLTGEGRVAGYPVAVPMVDMHTIGAGGGSIAWVDEGGLLQVGPRSAGAMPGPACYGRGGEAPTVTDANLLLGRLLPEAFLGGRMRLDPGAARRAFLRLGRRLGMTPEEAAAGVVRLAEEHMTGALRVISVQRGIDPRDFTLVSFGGAGGVHVCALAEALGCRQALVPMHAGVLSALGMLVARPGRQLSRTLSQPLAQLEEETVAAVFAALGEQGRAALVAEGLAPEALTLRLSADLRYQGQSFTLNLPWPGLAQAEAAFHEAHRRRYGHTLPLPVELVNLRVAVHGPAPEVRLPTLSPHRPEADKPERYTTLVGVEGAVPVFARERLGAGFRLQGPALITEAVSTTYLAPGWRLEVDPEGHLRLSR